MLEQALKVVDAARNLGLEDRNGRTVSALGADELYKALDALRESIENFDRETGRKNVRALAQGHFPAVSDDDVEGESSTMDLRPKLAPSTGKNLEKENAEEKRNASKRTTSDPASSRHPRLSKPVLAAAVLASLTNSQRLTLSKTGKYDDLGDYGAYFDSADDLMRVIETINDKLAFAVSKVGWTPRLRAMAEALRVAQTQMYLEIDNGEGFVRIPAYYWGKLSVAIAETALDQDLIVTFPEPRPRNEKRMTEDYGHAPRPPASWQDDQ